MPAEVILREGPKANKDYPEGSSMEMEKRVAEPDVKK
jgi:hypothetical protein